MFGSGLELVRHGATEALHTCFPYTVAYTSCIQLEDRLRFFYFDLPFWYDTSQIILYQLRKLLPNIARGFLPSL